MFKLYTDAAVKGNPGPAAIGILIVGPEPAIEISQKITPMTNHEAEFVAAIHGFKELATRGYAGQNVQLISDSQLVIDALNKGYSKHYQSLYADLVAAADPFPVVIPTWQNDHQHHGAHTLALRGLHQA
jgi:ribonuclease HI